MRSFHTAALLVLQLSYCVATNGASLDGSVFIQCPVQLYIPNARDQVASYIKTNFFSEKLISYC